MQAVCSDIRFLVMNRKFFVFFLVFFFLEDQVILSHSGNILCIRAAQGKEENQDETANLEKR